MEGSRRTGIMEPFPGSQIKNGKPYGIVITSAML